MGDLITFTPRPRPAPAIPEPLSAEALRAHLEEIGQAALDLFESVRAVLDAEDCDTDLKDGADTEPSLAAPEHHSGSQVGWCWGGDGDRKAEAAEIALPVVAILPAVPGPSWPLPWSGRANCITIAAIALFDLIERVG